MEWLKGKKTYIVSAATAILVFLHSIGVIDEQTMTTLLGLFGAAGLASLRAGVSK